MYLCYCMSCETKWIKFTHTYILPKIASKFSRDFQSSCYIERSAVRIIGQTQGPCITKSMTERLNAVQLTCCKIHSIVNSSARPVCIAYPRCRWINTLERPKKFTSSAHARSIYASNKLFGRNRRGQNEVIKFD
jgi:hypothetical protein